MTIKCPKCHFVNTSDSKFCKECGTQLLPSEAISASVTKTLETPIRRLSIGSLFAERYQILEELGKGGMGEVYKVKDQKLDEEMALKLLKPEIAADQSIIDRFKNELKLARKIAHRNVCKMHDFHEKDETPYITMEYVKGEDLKSFIRKNEKLKEKEALSIAKQVCEGLVEAHNLGVVHRDLKPQNIMMDKKGQAKIMDFGIARSVEAPGITHTGMIIGTPDYISPEQAEGQEADHRSDIYSLGVILYEMVTGTVPFKGDTALSVALKHKVQLPSDPRKFNPNISEDMSRLILICMEKDRERRYQTAEALLDDLRNIEDGLPLGAKIQPRRDSFVASLARKKFFIPAAVAVFAIIAIAIWQLLPQNGVVYPPTIENSIAVISFENQTKDEVSDDFQKIIPNLLITSLEQTELFHVVTLERMRDLLKQMGKVDVDIITSDLGFQACRREGIKALALGSYAKVGETFVTDIKVLDVESKRLLKSASSRGEGEGSIFVQIDELSKNIAEGMGLSMQKIEAAKLNTSEVTTASIEAYKYFLKGREDYYKLHYEEARQSLEKAVIIDPEFAMAYLLLAEAYSTLGFAEARNEAYEKAKIYSEKATEKERLYIEAAYARRIERDQEKMLRLLKQITTEYPKEKRAYFQLGDYYSKNRLYDKAIQEFNKAIELDPNYGITINQLAFVYATMKDYEKAIEYFERYASVSPGDPNPLHSMAGCFFSMGRLDEAVTKYKEAMEVKPDWIYTYWSISYINALEEDYSEAMKWVDRGIAIAHTPSGKAEGLLLKGFYYFWLGSFDQSLKEIRTASILVESEGNNRLKARADWIEGYVYNEKGEHEFARKSWKSWDDHRRKYNSPTIDKLNKAILLGRIELKEAKIDSLKPQLAEIESLLREQTPSIRRRYKPLCDSLYVEVLLEEGSLEDAIAMGNELAWGFSISTFGTIAFNNLYFFKDILARIYRQKGELDKAIAEYERLMTYGPESKDRRLIHPLFHFRLAKLYEEKGWEGKAIEHYERFLELWKDADPSTPEIEDAKKKLAGLKRQ